MKITKITGYILIALSIMAGSSAFGSIVTTKHNLSTTGSHTIKSTTEEQICIFCHTPHHARTDVPLLWNRNNSSVQYITYDSSSISSVPGQPSGASRLCLSCHDGTIAIGSVLSRTQEIPLSGGVRFMPEGPTKLGTDLSDDHPVSMLYNTNHPQMHDPSTFSEGVKVDENNMVQCTSCHEPHGTNYDYFLRRSRSASALCLTCHDKAGWAGASHKTSARTWNGQGTDPWQHTAITFSTVAENACENCHDPHGGGADERILKYAILEDNCLPCHTGNVALKNVLLEFQKPYNHPVINSTYEGRHSPNEDVTTGGVQKHVECPDCHNPHFANRDGASAPAVRGFNKGVSGVDTNGQYVQEIQYLYELCYKCHADWNVKTAAPVRRQLDQWNVRLEFDPGNPAYHPIEAPGQNPDVPSLRTPYTENSIIYCVDCHASNNTGVRGPHGSGNNFILERRYDHVDPNAFSEAKYAMCFKCHFWTNGLDREAFEHKRHMENADAACFACHDPHGVNSQDIAAIGHTAINHLHNINFNLDTDLANPFGPKTVPTYESTGNRRGRCNLRCHGEDHERDGGFRSYNCPC
ncbi:MAG: hypothetical protein ISR96_11450 [Nitrospira sp.]|nr:hypothetical protein [bacterium]MBL7050120.1 hypothetical protein [Nitrospira sp.]